MRLARLGLILLAGIFVASAMVIAIDYTTYIDREMTIADEGQVFDIASGRSFSGVVKELESLGLITRPLFFRLHARLNGKEQSIQAGEYLIEQGTTPRQLLEQFTNGSVRQYVFTIIEGWNRWELLTALGKHPALDVTLTDEDWPEFLQSLGAETTNPEGLFLPETYHFPRNTTGRELLADAFEAMQAVLAEEWAAKSPDAVVTTPYEALILASIVEKETARADERARIAGVFTRRLQKGMRLQTDPTVIYGLQPGFDGNLTRSNLRADTPYNTYRRGGLPPTPIAMAGRAAIRAALNPLDGPELFFVATGLGDGSHKFSTTKEEHDEAVREYLRRLRKGSGT